ncbi:MAG: hypothetical protein ACTHLR_12355 [Rhizomicrobium sp.]
MFFTRLWPLVLAGLLFLPPAYADDAPQADDWSAWTANFDSVITACVKADEQGCLAKAFNSRERPGADAVSVTDKLYRDLRAAEAMLHDKEAGDLLWREYGIDGNDYLGTGYSVPLAGTFAGQYAYARQREYFVPNLCAEAVDPAVCPQREPDVWTWRLSAADLVRWQNRAVAALLAKRMPQADQAGFRRKTGVGAPIVRNNLPDLLIRFGSLPLAYYKGTVGRPGAVRVFFADYAQVKGKSLHDALVATGAASLIEKPDPAKTFFIWVYAPGPDSKASVASWNALFSILAAMH